MSPGLPGLQAPPTSPTPPKPQAVPVQYHFEFAYSKPPRAPFSQKWRCHRCGSSYQLAATRRCLIDGHYFCRRPTLDKRERKPSRVAKTTCKTTFDLSGWSNYNTWRRKELRAHAIKQDASLLWRARASSDSESNGSEDSLDEGEGFFEHEIPADCTANCDWFGECTRSRSAQMTRLSSEIDDVDEEMRDDLCTDEADWIGAISKPEPALRKRTRSLFEDLFGRDDEPPEKTTTDQEDDDSDEEEEEPLHELKKQDSPQRHHLGGIRALFQPRKWLASRRKSL